jgi:hypothetical protein
MTDNSTPRWYRVMENKTKKIYFARKGFGEDGTGVAVCDALNHCGMGARFTAEHMRQNYTVVGVHPNSEKFEQRFQYELNR